MAGIIVVDRIESDASYASSINIASPLVVANTVSFSQPVTVSNTFVVPAGTVSAPAITPTGDPNTGIYFPAADNIGFATNGVIRGRWTTDGLCFGSDTAAANALDDYEEGTFTPRASDGSNNQSTTGSGEYVKIGKLVYIMLNINNISSFPELAGQFEIANLPFTPDSSFNQPMSVFFNSININDNAKFVTAVTKTSAAKLLFYEVFDNASVEAIQAVDIADDVTDIWVSGCYKIS